ncbi:MAG: septum formation inhibitor Maf [Deltaproteobacteria bacterium]|nr:MAG: septum formation inhibitor Maf [Deltaproteobacteria bacterium]RLC18794.1 MAG: septum formation inhibitor Maf [Deltaproteobacteria bacterium]
MKNEMEKPRLILASKSPRRKELLEQAGLIVTVVPSCVDEDGINITAPENLVKTLAEAKAREVAGAYPESWVIGADTIVLIDGEILGKPDSTETARRMIQQLNGQTHEVFTGYAIFCEAMKTCISGVEKTDVHFRNLSQQEIEWYIQTDEPYDKAGAYAIQGLGSFLVKRICGSYTNVVGLPVCEVLEHLLKTGIIEREIR